MSSVKVNAVLLFPRGRCQHGSVSGTKLYPTAVSQLAQTTIRSVVGQFELDEILSQRGQSGTPNSKSFSIPDTEPWGVKVSKVEVKQVDIPEQMQRAHRSPGPKPNAKRRAKIIHAEGEFEAFAKNLPTPPKVLETQPTAIQLRYLQTLTEIGVEEEHNDCVSAAHRYH